MKRIESFKTFSQLQTQLKEEAKQKEIASKREASSVAFNELLSKYGVASISDLNEEERTSFLKELQEGKLDSYYQMTAAKRLAKKDGYDFDKLPKYDRTSDKHQEYYLELAANESEDVEEGNAFSAARAKAIADGKKEFTVNGETYPVEDVDKEDKENAEEFVDESEDINLDFESVEERNAFIFAAAQAKKDGKKRFTFNGKTYPVTLKVDLLK